MEIADTQNIRLLALSFAGLAFAVFVIISIILNYHWKSYGVKKEDVSKLRKIYFIVSAVLLTAASVATILII